MRQDPYRWADGTARPANLIAASTLATSEQRLASQAPLRREIRARVLK